MTSGKLEKGLVYNVMLLSILPQVSSAHKAIQVREPYERLLSAYRCLVLQLLVVDFNTMFKSLSLCSGLYLLVVVGSS